MFQDEAGFGRINKPKACWCDNAGWHKSKNLIIPENIELFSLLPYTPELNPIEMIWDEVREKGFLNEIFATLSNVVDRLSNTLCSLMDNSDKIKSITGWEWILSMF